MAALLGRILRLGGTVAFIAAAVLLVPVLLNVLPLLILHRVGLAYFLVWLVWPAGAACLGWTLRLWAGALLARAAGEG